MGNIGNKGGTLAKRYVHHARNEENNYNSIITSLFYNYCTILTPVKRWTSKVIFFCKMNPWPVTGEFMKDSAHLYQRSVGLA